MQKTFTTDLLAGEAPRLSQVDPLRVARDRRDACPAAVC